MKIKSQKIIDKNGKIQEYFVNHFNSDGLLERKEYLSAKGDLEFYSIYKYDLNGNWIIKKEYDSDGEIQVSFEREFDSNNREIKSIELTAENKIWEWYEKQYPDDKTVIYLSKDEHGKVDHKTIENTQTGEQKRFREEDIVYAIIKEEFDQKKRLINRKTIDTKENISEENQYSYVDASQIWKLFIDGKYIKTEEKKTDRNGNVEFYIRKDNNGKSLEWSKSEFDNFNNLISIEGGKEENKPTYKTTIEIEYLDKKTLANNGYN
jgi:hypothetical protein